jgi:hypothetical protein
VFAGSPDHSQSIRPSDTAGVALMLTLVAVHKNDPRYTDDYPNEVSLTVF